MNYYFMKVVLGWQFSKWGNENNINIWMLYTHSLSHSSPQTKHPRSNKNFYFSFYLIDSEWDLDRTILENLSHYTVRIRINSVSTDAEVLWIPPEQVVFFTFLLALGSRIRRLASRMGASSMIKVRITLPKRKKEKNTFSYLCCIIQKQIDERPKSNSRFS